MVRMVWMAWIVAREGLAICDEATTLSRVERDRPVIGIGVREGTSGTSGEVPWRQTQNGVGLKTSKRKVKKNDEMKKKQEKDRLPETP